MRTSIAVTALLLSTSACKSDSGRGESTNQAPSATTTANKPVADRVEKPAANDDAAKALAAKATAELTIDGLKLRITVPEGTTVAPARNADEASRHAHLAQGEFKVNVDAVDEYSTPDFAKAKEVYKADKLVSWIRADETPKGWITFKEVVSDFHKDHRFEVSVRTQIGDQKWDCTISAPSKALAELTLAACQTLR
ncbi:MAG: hypothetical protein ACKV2T_25700 [Kofleriaceae bacterium]